MTRTASTRPTSRCRSSTSSRWSAACSRSPAISDPVFAPGLLAGQTALITGGGTGIGLAIARELGGLGARVVLAARDLDRLEQAAAGMRAEGIDAEAERVNVRDEDAVAALLAAVTARHGVPDLLVNNAGGQFEAPALDITPNGFRAVVDLNLTGTWLMSTDYARAAVAAGRPGRIITIVLVVEHGMPGMAHAGAARAGAINLTRTLAREWGPHGILVNAVAGGTIDTPALEQYDAQALAAGVARLPVARMGSPREVAQAVAYLASPAGSYVTGAVLPVDGGEHLAG